MVSRSFLVTSVPPVLLLPLPQPPPVTPASLTAPGHVVQYLAPGALHLLFPHDLLPHGLQVCAYVLPVYFLRTS